MSFSTNDWKPKRWPDRIPARSRSWLDRGQFLVKTGCCHSDLRWHPLAFCQTPATWRRTCGQRIHHPPQTAKTLVCPRSTPAACAVGSTPTRAGLPEKSAIRHASARVGPAVGALGSFVTGSATASNVSFTSLQGQTAQALALPVMAIVAGQGFGAAVGNIVCPHNIVVRAATVGLAGRESEIVQRMLLPCAIYLALCGAVLSGLLWSGFLA